MFRFEVKTQPQSLLSFINTVRRNAKYGCGLLCS